MPYLNGKRCTNEEWAAQQAAQKSDAEAWATRTNADRAALLVTHALRVPDVTAADYPGAGEDATTVDVLKRGRQPRSEAAAMAAIADALGVAQDSEEMAAIDLSNTAEYTGTRQAIAVPLDHEPVEVTSPRETARGASEAPKDAEVPVGPTHRAKEASWRESHGIERPHRADRPSQLPAGRRDRYLRADVAAGHCPNVASAAQRHPTRTAKEVQP